MRQLRHRIVLAIGLLVLAGVTTTAALAQPQGAKRGQQARTERHAPGPFGHARSANRGPQQMQRASLRARPSAAVTYRTTRVGGRLVREPVSSGGSFLPGFRVPQGWDQPSAPRNAVSLRRRKRPARFSMPVPAGKPCAPSRPVPIAPASRRRSRLRRPSAGTGRPPWSPRRAAILAPIRPVWRDAGAPGS